MVIKTEEYEAVTESYLDSIGKMKIGLYRLGKDSLLSYGEIESFVAENLKPFLFEWYSERCCRSETDKRGNVTGVCQYNHCTRSGCSNREEFPKKIHEIISGHKIMDLFERVLSEIPIKGKFDFYKLSSEAIEKIFTHKIRYYTNKYYRSNPEYFQDEFKASDENEMEKIVAAIFDIRQEEHNKELDEWLSKNYPDIVKKIGMGLVEAGQDLESKAR